MIDLSIDFDDVRSRIKASDTGIRVGGSHLDIYQHRLVEGLIYFNDRKIVAVSRECASGDDPVTSAICLEEVVTDHELDAIHKEIKSTRLAVVTVEIGRSTDNPYVLIYNNHNPLTSLCLCLAESRVIASWNFMAVARRSNRNIISNGFLARWLTLQPHQYNNGTIFKNIHRTTINTETLVTRDKIRGVDNISFAAGRGGITFLVGGTGAGKSTIFKLALKSIEPDHGRILIDGVDLLTIDRADWYSAVAVVPQDIVLLNESLKDNILLGRPYDEERLHQAARKAAIFSFIRDLPDGFETTVGERGLKLSGGERQRIAVARALYGNPTILLLDEASSALDETTERDIMEHIRLLAREVTVLAITHRRSVITEADKVVKLADPRIPASA
ncbi:ATP-binding cassette domain-containing protein [Rhizobium leguminosarum]|nr:ATP-binding cassette domain-containing protein [Rhizobium leguminosarum]